MATLTGWGLIWLLLQENSPDGDIVLVDANIRYRKAVAGRPEAIASRDKLSGDRIVWHAAVKRGLSWK